MNNSKKSKKLNPSININVHKELYCLNDIHQSSGNKAKHKPLNFLNLDSTKQLIHQMGGIRKGIIKKYQSIDGIIMENGDEIYTCRDIAILYAIWINQKFGLSIINYFYSQNKISPKDKKDIMLGVNKKVFRSAGTLNHSLVYQKIHNIAEVNSYHEITKDKLQAVIDYLDDDKDFIVKKEKVLTKELSEHELRSLLWLWYGFKKSMDLIDEIKDPLNLLGSKYGFEINRFKKEFDNILEVSKMPVNKLTGKVKKDLDGIALPLYNFK